MIVQFSVENFKSIHDQAVFSMLASSDDAHLQYLRDVDNLKVLPSTIIVGTNGAGKSNLFQALKYLQQLIQVDHNKKLPYYPHKLKKNDELTELDVQFAIDNTRYAYGISLTKNKVHSEYLYSIKDNQRVKLFEREIDSVSIVNKPPMTIEDTVVALRYLNEHSEDVCIQEVYDFLVYKIIIVLTENNDEESLFKFACEQFRIEKNQIIVSKLVKRLDIGINEIVVKDQDIIVQYENMEINLLEESTGNKKLFMLLALISDVVNDGKVVLFDELEKNLHIMLVTYIIKMFNAKETNKQNAQLVFSTHNTGLLNLNLFRRDQVWLMEKNFKNLNTELYSLYSILDVLDDENIEYGYISGKYGATFKINFNEVVGYDE